MIHPHIIQTTDRDTFAIDANGDLMKSLKKKPKPILWVRQGIYGIIPVEVIKNELQIREDREKLGDEQWLPLTFTWRETVTIPQATGRTMEEYNV